MAAKQRCFQAHPSIAAARDCGTWVCLLAAAVWLGGCDDDNRHEGFLGNVTEDFSGSWREALTETGNTCLFPGVGNSEHIVSIAQEGVDASIDCVDLCGGLFCRMAGTVAGSTLRVQFSDSVPSDILLCYDNFEFSLAGTLEGDVVRGTITTRYFRAGSLCPLEEQGSCTISYAFEWTSCPPADCAIQACAVTLQSVPSATPQFWGP